MVRISLSVLVVLGSCTTALAQNSTWNVDANGSWQNVSNWNPAYVPNYFSDTATLGNVISANRIVTLDAPVELDQLRFQVNGSAGYTLTSSAAANTLKTNFIYNGHFTSTATTNINLAANASGNLITGSNNSLNVSNYSSSGTTLNFGSTTTFATPSGSGGVGFSNYNNAGNVINVNGNIGAPGKGFNSIVVGGDYTSTGTVVFRGDNSNNSGSIGVFNGGHLLLDYTSSNTSKTGDANSSFYIINSTLTLQGNAAATTQAANGLAGYGTITVHLNSGAGGLTFSPGLLGLSSNGSIDFATMPVTGSISGAQSNTNGILFDSSRGIRGNVVIGSNTWATRSGSNLVGYTGYVTTFSPTSNTDVTTSVGPAAFTTNTLRFNTAAPITLTMTGSNSVEAGGILVTPNVGANTSTITGGTLTSTGDINIIQHNTAGALSIQSSINLSSSGQELIKTGAGTLTLDGTAANTSLNRVEMYSGTLNLSKPAGTAAIGGNLTVRGGTVNIATNNLPSNANIQLQNGQINFLGPQTINVFNQNAGGFSNANLTFTGAGGGALFLGGGTYNYNGTAYTFASASGGNIYLTNNSSRFPTMTSTNAGATPVFNFGGVTRSVFLTAGTVNTFNGLHFGNGNMVLDGVGSLILNGSETFTGNTTLQRAQLFVNSNYASPITMQPNLGMGGTLGGTGIITQTVTVTGNGNVLSPGTYYDYTGTSALSPGILTLAGLNATSGNFAMWMDILGTTAGTQYDRLEITGAVQLGSGNYLYLVDQGYTAPLGSSFLIMTRGPGSSGFLTNPSTGLPFTEGEVFSSSPSNHFQISYQAGDGNDISLTTVAVPEPATWAMIGLLVAGTGYGIAHKRRRSSQLQDTEVDHYPQF